MTENSPASTMSKHPLGTFLWVLIGIEINSIVMSLARIVLFLLKLAPKFTVGVMLPRDLIFVGLSIAATLGILMRKKWGAYLIFVNIILSLLLLFFPLQIFGVDPATKAGIKVFGVIFTLSYMGLWFWAFKLRWSIFDPSTHKLSLVSSTEQPLPSQTQDREVQDQTKLGYFLIGLIIVSILKQFSNLSHSILIFTAIVQGSEATATPKAYLVYWLLIYVSFFGLFVTGIFLRKKWGAIGILSLLIIDPFVNYLLLPWISFAERPKEWFFGLEIYFAVFAVWGFALRRRWRIFK